MYVYTCTVYYYVLQKVRQCSHTETNNKNESTVSESLTQGESLISFQGLLSAHLESESGCMGVSLPLRASQIHKVEQTGLDLGY